MVMDLKEALIKVGSRHPEHQDQVRRLLRAMEKESMEILKDHGKRLFSNKLLKRFKRGFSKRNIRPLLMFYQRLRPIYEGTMDPPEEGFATRWRDIMKRVIRDVEDENVADFVEGLASDAKRIFRRMDSMDDVSKNNRKMKNVLNRLLPMLQDLFVRLGRDKDIYMKGITLKRPGFIKFELMDSRERKYERYKDRDEELADLEKEKDRLRDKINERIESEIERSGYNADRRPMADQVPMVGEKVQDDKKMKGKKRGDDVWMINEEFTDQLDLNELTGSTIELELEIDGKTYKVDDFKKEGGNWYIKTKSGDIPKQWGNCTLREKEVLVWDDDGDVLGPEEYKQKRKEHLESMDRLTNVMPKDEDFGDLRKFGTFVTGDARAGDVSDHGLGRKDAWVLVDKDPSFDPFQEVLDDPNGTLLFKLTSESTMERDPDDDDDAYEVVEVDTHVRPKDNQEFVHLELARPLNRSHGGYQLFEKSNIVDEYLENEEPEYRALSDDPDKRKAFTKIFPTVEIHGETVIASGRYKGIVLEDMINAKGRLIEGTAYDFDTETGLPTTLSNVEDAELREPYVTESEDDRLLLRIPSKNEFSDLRNKMGDLAQEAGKVNALENTGQTLFKFDPEHFRSVRETLKSVALSKKAKNKVESYFENMRKEQNKFSDENLRRYDADQMGGFTENFDFRNSQKEALAWLDGGSGMIGADTGAGKTLIGIGYTKDLMRKGVLEDEDDEVLFLHPASLRGNIESEVESFVENPEEVKKHLVTMTYSEFTYEMDVEHDPNEENKRDPDLDVIKGSDKDFIQQFEAVICDEASYLKSRTSKQSLMMQADHPRKVLMSASPMEKDPQDLYILTAIANNWELNDLDGLDNKRKFASRYSKTVGDKVAGVTEDPIQKQDLVDWMSVNMFQIDKTEMDDVDLPSLERDQETVTMPEEVEEEYRLLTGRIEEFLEKAVKFFRDRDEATYKEFKEEADMEGIESLEGITASLSGLFARLDQLQNQPDEVVDGVDHNPKLDRTIDHIKDEMGNSTRFLCWTDSPSFAPKAARYLSKELPGTKHASGTTDAIIVFKNGEVHEKYTESIYMDPETGEPMEDEKMWRNVIAEKYIQPNRDVISFTLTQSFTKGFNLQDFTRVVHLDRDGWNAENMKQRTARSWRQGQDEKVEETTIDMSFEEPQDENDRTLDRIRSYFQELEEGLFDEFVKETMKETPGKSWFGMKKEDAEMYDVERDIVELLMSPYAENFSEVKKKLKRAEMGGGQQ
jgi:hypothetical protein